MASLEPARLVRPSALSGPGCSCSAPGARSGAPRHGEPARCPRSPAQPAGPAEHQAWGSACFHGLPHGHRTLEAVPPGASPRTQDTWGSAAVGFPMDTGHLGQCRHGLPHGHRAARAAPPWASLWTQDTRGSAGMGFPTDTGHLPVNVTVRSYATASFLPAPGAFQAGTCVRPCCQSDKTRSQVTSSGAAASGGGGVTVPEVFKGRLSGTQCYGPVDTVVLGDRFGWTIWVQ